MRILCGTILAAVFAAGAAMAGEGSGATNLVSEVRRRVSASAYSDIESAYWARGAIVDKRPYSAQFADLSIDLDPFGRIGGYAWSVSSLSKSGQSATRRRSPART